MENDERKQREKEQIYGKCKGKGKEVDELAHKEDKKRSKETFINKSFFKASMPRNSDIQHVIQSIPETLLYR